MKRRQLALVLLIALAALFVHGYHPGAEDGEIYLPAIKKILQPALYPHGSEFFTSQTSLTAFPQLVAASVRVSHLPFDWVILLWHLGCIFVLLAACWRVGRQCFPGRFAPWGSTALVAALLTLPVAGTGLYIMDQYLSPRDFSTAGIMLMVANAIERRYVRLALWTIAVAAIHPLMAGFGVAFIVIWALEERRPALLRTRRKVAEAGTALLMLPIALGPVSPEYREALDSRRFLFLARWQWYECVGIVAPLVLLWCLRRYARRQMTSAGGSPCWHNLEALSRALIWFTLLFVAAAVLITIPPSFVGLVTLQPMRSLHLAYILLFVLLGGLLADRVLKFRTWRWVALFVPLCLVMFYAQRELFSADAHVEIPGVAPRNPWLQAFAWIRANTPPDAFFALDPQHMNQPGEDHQGFRALAERGRLADAGKDGAAVTLASGLAREWKNQLRALQGWNDFQPEDFRRLRQQFGVTWVVVRPGVTGLTCPYRNSAVSVCRSDAN